MSIRITIDGREIETREGTTVLRAALSCGVYIPHLCHHPDLPPFSASSPADIVYRARNEFRRCDEGSFAGCGLCAVEIEGRAEPALSCETAVSRGMAVTTDTEKLRALRRDALAVILATHPHACLTCAQKEGCSLTQCSSNVPENERCCPIFNSCELRKLAEYVGIREDVGRYVFRDLPVEEDDPLFVRDYNLCIGCLRCVRACTDLAGADALGYVMMDGAPLVGTASRTLDEKCRYCGLCVEVCPTGALRDRELSAGDREAALVPCTSSCPIHMEVPAYVRAIADGDYGRAAAVIRERTPLALALGYICHHPCEDACRRGKLSDPIGICDLKRFALETVEPGDVPAREPTGKRVAVAGAGPAGLVAAYFLGKLGHEVTVFESGPEPGGMLRWALPEYRLPREAVDRDVEKIRSAGVEIRAGERVDIGSLVEESKRGGWDALFIATGLPKSNRLNIEGAEGDGVHWGLDFLRAVRSGEGIRLGGKVVVVGGGDVAVDVAMTALRLGAARVDMVCLERRGEMPASPAQIEEAEEEGVVVHDGWGPLGIEREDGRVKAVELVRCTSVFDEAGKFAPAFDDDVRDVLECENVIFAIGQAADRDLLEGSGLELTEAGTIRADSHTLETSIPGVFAGGEAAAGPGSAVEAMAAGRRAASAIDRFLGGDGEIDALFPAGEPGMDRIELGPVERFGSRGRISPASLSPKERIRSFRPIHSRYGEEEAREEALRCLRCDLRLLVTPVTLPPERLSEFTPEAVAAAPETEGVVEILDGQKEVIFIAGTANIRKTLEERLFADPEARYFDFEEDPMYTKRESELIQHYLQSHGRLPRGNEELDDLF